MMWWLEFFSMFFQKSEETSSNVLSVCLPCQFLVVILMYFSTDARGAPYPDLWREAR